MRDSERDKVMPKCDQQAAARKEEEVSFRSNDEPKKKALCLGKSTHIVRSHRLVGSGFTTAYSLIMRKSAYITLSSKSDRSSSCLPLVR